MLQAPSGGFEIVESIPRSLLAGKVEAHPSVLTADPIALDTATAHSDYAGEYIPVEKYHPLAVGAGWDFYVQIKPSLESIFQWERTQPDELVDGQFEFIADVTERYVAIKANPTTYDALQVMRTRRFDLVLSTVYLSALNVALALLPPNGENENEHSSGWTSALRESMRERNISEEDIESGLAAQRLLGNPLSHLRTVALDEGLI